MTERDAYLDNVKAILIFFVVLGHFANLNRAIPLFGVVNNILYSFHMPLFIFISGYFSKKIVRQRRKEVETVLYAYVVFEILNLIYTESTSIGCGSYNLFVPCGDNWYLLGLFFWRLLLPYFHQFQRKTALSLVFIIAFGIGFYKQFNTFLGLYRILYFMPFFVLGSYCGDIRSWIVAHMRFRLLFIGILFVSFLVITTLSLHNTAYNYAIAYAFTPFKGYSSLTAQHLFLRFSLRIIGFVSSILLSISILFMVPARSVFFTPIGERTLNVYLLHMFIVYPVCWLFTQVDLNVGWMLLSSIMISVLLTQALSSSLVQSVMGPLTNATKLASIFRLNRFNRFKWPKYDTPN